MCLVLRVMADKSATAHNISQSIIASYSKEMGVEVFRKSDVPRGAGAEGGENIQTVQRLNR